MSQSDGNAGESVLEFFSHVTLPAYSQFLDSCLFLTPYTEGADFSCRCRCSKDFVLTFLRYPGSFRPRSIEARRLRIHRLRAKATSALIIETLGGESVAVTDIAHLALCFKEQAERMSFIDSACREPLLNTNYGGVNIFFVRDYKRGLHAVQCTHDYRYTHDCRYSEWWGLAHFPITDDCAWPEGSLVISP